MQNLSNPIKWYLGLLIKLCSSTRSDDEQKIDRFRFHYQLCSDLQCVALPILPQGRGKKDNCYWPFL